MPNYFKDLEYLQVIKNGEEMLTLDEKELKNKTKKDIQILIAKKVGSGLYNYVLKQKSEDKTHRGKIRTISLELTNPKLNNKTDELLINEIKRLNDKIEKIENVNVNNDQLTINKIFEQQITFYKNQIDEYKNEFKENEKEKELLTKKVNDLENKINNLDKEDNSMLEGLLLKFLGNNNMKQNNIKQSLSENNNITIPQEVIVFLSNYNWDKIDVPQFIDLLTKYENFLPEKKENEKQ